LKKTKYFENAYCENRVNLIKCHHTNLYSTRCISKKNESFLSHLVLKTFAI
jgi:hypothetical protein